MENVKDVAKILDEDWKALPNLIKLCYLNFALLVIVAWVFQDQPLTFHSFGFVTSTERVIFLLLVVMFLIPPLYWIAVTLRIRYYRWLKYPLRNVGISYYYRRTKTDAVYLVDKKRKIIRWIENPQTAYDLGYYHAGWAEPILGKKFILPVEGTKIKSYKLKRGIKTRGKSPGGLK